MLRVLSIAEARAIAEAAEARARDERAMLDYLGIGTRAARRAGGAGSRPPLVLATAADLAAFETGETRLRQLLLALSVEQRRELIALAWLGKSVDLGFDAALRRARRVPPESQLGYLMSRRLERHIPAALDKLRLAP